MDVIVPGGVAHDLDDAGSGRDPRDARHDRAPRFPSWSSSTTTPPRFRTAPSAPGSSHPRWSSGLRPAAMSAARPGAPSMRAARRAITLRRTALRRAGAGGGRCQRPRLDPHPRGRAEPVAGRGRSWTVCPRARAACRSIRTVQRARAWRWSRVFAATFWSWLRIARRPDRALPSARSLLVPVAAAGSGDRGQHRRRFSPLQQIVQLLLFRARSVGMTESGNRFPKRSCSKQRWAMRKLLFQSLFRAPLTEPAPSPDQAAVEELAAAVGRTARAAPRPEPLDPRNRRRILQRLRAGDPRAEQCLLRRRALRHPLRRVPAPCRCAAGHGTGDEKHARGAETNL